MAWIPKRTCARCLLESPNTRSIESTGSCPGTYGAPRPTRSGRLLRGKTSRRLRRTLTRNMQDADLLVTDGANGVASLELPAQDDTAAAILNPKPDSHGADEKHGHQEHNT